MPTRRISQLTAAQVQTVFSSDRFHQLTDGQLVALHHRREQLLAEFRKAQARRRRTWLLAVASVAVLIAAMPMWQTVLAATVSALLWWVAITVLRDASRAFGEAIGWPKRQG